MAQGSSSITMRQRALLLAGILASGIGTLLVVFFLTVRTIQVNGPLYVRMVQGKDLLADVLPPPLSAIEPYLVTERMALAASPAERAALLDEFRRLRNGFSESTVAWQRNLQEPALREALDRSCKPAQEFFEEVEDKLVPAWNAKDARGAAAALENIGRLYSEHRAAVDGLVKLTNDRNTRVDQEAQAEVRSRMAVALALALLVLAAVSGLAVWIGRALREQIASVGRESRKLTDAVLAGVLDERGQPAAVAPEFRDVVKGMNETMEAFVRPVRLSTDYLARVTKGQIPPRIEEEYRGEFEQVKKSWNRLIEVMERRGKDLGTILRSVRAGQLSVRIDATPYEGQNAELMKGMNGLVEAVAGPLREAIRMLERMAQRDLTARMQSECAGEFAEMKEAINATATALHDALAQVAQAAGQVSSASAQIASSSQAVASGASEQASSLEETGASLESMSNATRQAADNAQQASTLASAASSAATEGSAAMEQMTSAMARIKSSAEGTSQIIKDINEIAFQTNLLALNAAVEAARAGEAGRGFAVVAEEVRSLALRSKEAANKTEELIRQSVREAGEGEITAGHVNEKLSQIVAAISKATSIVAEITAASKEQVGGIDRINKAMSQMSSVTQQNAASSEESSSSAEELAGQAEELSAMVASFQLERASGARQAAARKAAPGAPKPTVKSTRNGHATPLVNPEDVIPMEREASFKEF